MASHFWQAATHFYPDDKKILGHEETFVERIRKRKEQLLKFNTQISPIYTTYKTTPNSLKKLNSAGVDPISSLL